MDLLLHKQAILLKIRAIEKKFSASYRMTSDVDKRVGIQQHIKYLDEIIRKLDEQTLTWEDLERIGITKKAILTLSDDVQDQTPSSFEEFKMLSTIPIHQYIVTPHIDPKSLNILYSIISYINEHYQAIFAQKMLISASKTNVIRQHFFTQQQEIFHIFQSYKEFISVSKKKPELDILLEKEYLILLKAISNYLTNIQMYIKLIFSDDTFTFEDFQEKIKATDSSSFVHGMTLRASLEDCQNFINEAILYIEQQNKDIFDSLTLDKELHKKNNKY